MVAVGVGGGRRGGALLGRAAALLLGRPLFGARLGRPAALHRAGRLDAGGGLE